MSGKKTTKETFWKKNLKEIWDSLKSNGIAWGDLKDENVQKKFEEGKKEWQNKLEEMNKPDEYIELVKWFEDNFFITTSRSQKPSFLFGERSDFTYEDAKREKTEKDVIFYKSFFKECLEKKANEIDGYIETRKEEYKNENNKDFPFSAWQFLRKIVIANQYFKGNFDYFCYVSDDIQDFVELMKLNDCQSKNFFELSQEIFKAAKAAVGLKDEDDNIANALRLSSSLMKLTDQFDYLKFLKNNYNIILHGAPGTGKTYLAKEIAKKLIFGDEEVFIDKTDKELNNEPEIIKKRDEQEKLFEKQYGFVQFHQSYDYTDFVEGLRPKDDGKGNIGFERRDGVFKAFCSRPLDQVQSSLDKIIRDREKFETISGNKFFIVGYNVDDIIVQAENLKEHLARNPKRADLLKLLNSGKKFDSPSDVRVFLDPEQKHSQSSESYLFPIFKRILNDNDIDKKYVFVIDEINRGEMSKIFGELFYSVDPGYRGKDGSIKTQYANLQQEPNEFDIALGITKKEIGLEGKTIDLNKDNYGHFFVPENVYIIGTMNDIDRSVESMDFAMRRRFAFKEVTAEQSQTMFGNGEWKNGMGEKINVRNQLEKIKNRMNNLNQAILNDKYHLGQSYQIGGAYFLKFANYYDPQKKNEDDAFNSLWTYQIEGVLREYLRGMDNVEGKLEELKNAYENESASKNAKKGRKKGKVEEEVK